MEERRVTRYGFYKVREMKERRESISGILDTHSMIHLRRIIKNRDFHDFRKFMRYFNDVLGSGIKVKTKQQLEKLKKLSKTIDMKIVGILVDKEEVGFKELLLMVEPLPHHVYLRLEVLDSVGVVEFDEKEMVVRRGEMFGKVDIMNLPLHADQIPLGPREKMVYLVIKRAEEGVGVRTLREIGNIIVTLGDRVSVDAVHLAVKRLKNIGLVDKVESEFGYKIYKTLEDVKVFEDFETLMLLCRRISELTQSWRNRKGEE